MGIFQQLLKKINSLWVDVYPLTKTKGVTNDSGVNVDDLLATKQDNLLSGINIKTVENKSILGSGNVKIIDDTDTSTATTWSSSKIDSSLNGLDSSIKGLEASKLTKVTVSWKIYGTDESGEQTTFDKDEVGIQIDDGVTATDKTWSSNKTNTQINAAVSTHNSASNAHSNLRGVVNGLATLDSNGKVPLALMNDAVLGNVNYMGTWNASTNDPYLPDPAGELPVGYTQLGYINVTSGNYIDTGIKFDTDSLEVQCKFSTSNVRVAIFGASTGGSSDGLSGAVPSIYVTVTMGNVYIGNNSYTIPGWKRETEFDIKIKATKSTNAVEFTTNGNTQFLTYTGIPNEENSIYLCRIHTTNETTLYGNGKIYKFLIKKDGVIVCNYIPAQRTSDSVYGFYDIINNVFMENIGTGTFTGGGQIEIPKGNYYITSVAGTRFGNHYEVGDWIISQGNAWGRVANTDAVASVQGRTGNVVLINDDIESNDYTWSSEKIAQLSGVSWGGITGDIKNQTDLYKKLRRLAKLAKAGL